MKRTFKSVLKQAPVGRGRKGFAGADDDNKIVKHRISYFAGYGIPEEHKMAAKKRRSSGHKRRGSTKLGRAAKACKGKKAGAFRACVRKHLKAGGHKRKHHKR